MKQITFATNASYNTLEYLKLLLRSLQTNLDSDEHEILVFIDSDSENTFDYLLSIKDQFKDLTIVKNEASIPLGYQRNKTLLTEYAKHDIISYLQSDMVIGPHYDTEILKHVQRGRILSSTRVEPPLHGQSPVTVTKNFGLSPDEFNFDGWNAFSNTVKRDELINYFFAPITYYKDDWMKLGGYDTVFRRAREDSDLVQRCIHAGIELVQTFSANVYHFTCVSSRGKDWYNRNNQAAQQRANMQSIADSIEMRRFIRKWGNFNHGDHKLFKLDTDLVILNGSVSYVAQLEPFFSRVWLPTDQDRNRILAEYEQYQLPANTLLNISDEDWNKYKHLYRTESFDEIFCVGMPKHYRTKITIDAASLGQSNQFLSNLQNMYEMLVDCEQGEYELDGVFVSVNDVSTIPTSIEANNPPFNYSLLTVH